MVVIFRASQTLVGRLGVVLQGVNVEPVHLVLLLKAFLLPKGVGLLLVLLIATTINLVAALHHTPHN